MVTKGMAMVIVTVEKAGWVFMTDILGCGIKFVNPAPKVNITPFGCKISKRVMC